MILRGCRDSGIAKLSIRIRVLSSLKAICCSFCIRIPARPTGLETTTIVVSLSGSKYAVVVSPESVVLIALNAVSCCSPHFHGVSFL